MGLQEAVAEPEVLTAEARNRNGDPLHKLIFKGITIIF
jgi:hypothetical protein